MSEILVSVFARTDVGMHRAGNEDSFLVADLTAGKVGLGPDVSKHLLGERGSLMIVSDGMGGAAAGEIASEMAVTSIRESLVEMTPSMEISERLRSAAEIANEQIWNRSQDNPELSGMGATLTAVLVQGTTAYIAQVGDSRAYLMRRGQIKQLTKDQSLAQMLVDSGAIKPDQMDSVPQNVIMQAMGTQPAVKVAMSAVELCKNDCLVICSDGLSNKIPPNDLREMIQDVEDLTEACRLLIDKANERGGEDNITVVIARFDGEALHSATESGSITGSFRALNQGYSSEYFSGARSVSSPPTEEEPDPELEQKQITTMLNSADLARFASGAPVPAATDDTAQFEAPVMSEAEIDEAEFRSRPTADRPLLEDAATGSATAQVTPAKRSYAVILIIALISLLLLGATGFFVYSIYMKQKSPPADVQQQPE
ncbi:MAG: Stp1/IreP family PP2C-type Ser/Thr phosphatase [Acidobacteria bacterium]|nr:MAG: Stp1/IreP family PP2C-type Ser/Thr phosphatase [Acidobacteriota bacterium]